MELLNKPPEAYLLMERYMPETFNSIFGIRALVMQLLDYHPYCNGQLVPTHCLASPRLRLTGLYALCHKLLHTGHIEPGHCFKTALQRERPRNAYLIGAWPGKLTTARPFH